MFGYLSMNLNSLGEIGLPSENNLGVIRSRSSREEVCKREIENFFVSYPNSGEKNHFK